MPKRRGQLFLPLAVDFWEDTKVRRAGERAAVLYLHMCLASKRWGTDGILEPEQMDLLHLPDWRKRLAPLVTNELILPLDEPPSWAITAWFQHNDPMSVITARRAKDADYQKDKRRDRVGTDNPWTSEPSRYTREEKREEETSVGPTSGVDEDCEHGVDRFASCLQCAKQQATG